MRNSTYVALIAVLLVALGGCSSGPGVSQDFTLTTLDGETIRLSDLRGKPVVLNFWSSQCPYCDIAAPRLDTLYRKYEGEELQVLGIAGRDSAQALRDKVRRLNLTYPTGMSPEAGQAYGVRGVPMTFFIDREGRVVSSLLGARAVEEFEAEVRKII